MTIHPTTRSRAFALAAALALSAAAFAPTTLLAANARHHHVAGHAALPGTEAGTPGASKNAAEDDSCWMMTDRDHSYGYNVPCTLRGAEHR